MSMARPGVGGAFVLTLLLGLPTACGRNGMAVPGLDAAPDLAPPEDTTPGQPDLPGPPPDLPKTPDLLASDPPLLLDLPFPRDLPSDPVSLRDRPLDREPGVDLLPDGRRDLAPVDVGPPDLRGVDLLPDLPRPVDADLADRPRAEVRPVDQAPDKPDSYIPVEEVGGAAAYCISTGGTIDTQSCCTNTTDFRDTCTTAAGACGCSPANSRTVQVCVCPTPTCFLPGWGCVGPGSTCTVGMDQTCNDNPVISSVRGRCVDNGRCLCTTGMSPTSGKCL